MSTIHTQGRITVRENGEANSYAILDDKGQWLLSLLHNGQQVVETQRENLRRLVACWNACEGISTIRLERTVNNLHGRASASDRLDELRAQRDELLAALRAVDVLFGHLAKDSTQKTWIDNARAAIANAEGGAA